MEGNFRRKKNKPRQEWNPHWILKVLYALWTAAWSVVKVAVGAVGTVLMILVVCGLVFVGILGDYLQNDILPEAATIDISSYEQDLTSFLYYTDSDGNIQQLQRIYTDIDRQLASQDEIPEDLIHAAVAIEDKRFYEHQGVDWITTVKACANLFFGSDSKFGGSTITQQLIKNRTGEDSVTVQRKVTEIFQAQYCEQQYTKDEIMVEYLNTIYLGRGCYGVKSAAAEYFGKELSELTAAECASLISITNNPSMFNPYSKSEYEYEGEITDGAGRNRIRQVNTLFEMRNQGWLTEEEYQEALAQEMVFKSGIVDEEEQATCSNSACGYTGALSTFASVGGQDLCPDCGTPLAAETQEVYSWFVEVVMEEVAQALAEKDGVDWDNADSGIRSQYRDKLKRGGYHVFTTLDMDVQNQVDAIYTDLSQIPTAKSAQQLQSGIVVIDNFTGDIVAISGGVGEKVDFDAYNRATDAKLQTGSSTKPITVYAPAFEIGAITPASVVLDMPLYYAGSIPFPRNDNRTYSYSRTIYSGIVSSVNAIAVNTLDMIGFDYSYDFAKNKFGISDLTESYETASGRILTDLGYSPLAMGALTIGATIRDMANAYATFANEGVYREARTFTKVYDTNGNLVLDNEQYSEQILSEKTVNYMNYCLAGAVSSGTGTAAAISGQEVAGKTGTTSSNKDRWFCGYTGYYTAAVWCGYDTPEVITLTGSNTSNPAARLWKKVLAPLHEGLEKVKLYDTSDFRAYSVCLDSGLKATDACGIDLREYAYGLNRVASAYAAQSDAPDGSCKMHVVVDYCETGKGVANDYCYYSDAKIVERALVKLTQSQVEAIKEAGSAGLNSNYLWDNYVYYVSDGGSPLAWHGFKGNANAGEDEPYIVCSVHDRHSVEEEEEEDEDDYDYDWGWGGR